MRPFWRTPICLLVTATFILAFISLPITTTSTLILAAVIGLLWLGTVPLTSGLVAQVFGTR